MANKWQAVWLGLIITAAFLAGGWFFSRTGSNGIKQEIEGLYQKDGASVGIFDGVPEDDMAAAEQIADEALYTPKPVLPEDRPEYNRHDGQDLPTQLTRTEWKEIAGVAPKPKPEEKIETSMEMIAPAGPTPSQVYLNGNEVAAIGGQTVGVVEDDG
ncbi:MAG: hypothetical protein J6U96_00465, partial [Elusimicrobiaceae bacterium]|nr:hypothetical protein [Elusimicrobiaceae bacterium]